MAASSDSDIIRLIAPPLDVVSLLLGRVVRGLITRVTRMDELSLKYYLEITWRAHPIPRSHLLYEFFFFSGSNWLSCKNVKMIWAALQPFTDHFYGSWVLTFLQGAWELR